jgi:hypothetical protein
MTVDGDRDVTSHQARKRLRPTSKTTAASAFLLVVFTFVLGQTHFIRKAVGNSPSSPGEAYGLCRQ